MVSGVPHETCWAFRKFWNNKFYYKVASCWYFYRVIYDARIHEYQAISFLRSTVVHTVKLARSCFYVIIGARACVRARARVCVRSAVTSPYDTEAWNVCTGVSIIKTSVVNIQLRSHSNVPLKWTGNSAQRILLPLAADRYDSYKNIT